MDQNEFQEKIVFVDTSALIGIFNEADQYHAEAIKIYKQLKQKGIKLIISNYIVAESHALFLGRTKNPPQGFKLLDTLYDVNEFSVIFVAEEIETEARDEVKKYKDKVWSITDVASFVVMKKLKLLYYFSFDGDFKQNSNFQDIKSYL